MLSPEYGKAAERDSSTALRMTDGAERGDSSTARSSAQNDRSGEGSYIEDTQLDTYFNDLEERAQVIQDKRIAEANSALMSAPNTEKKTLPEKVRESVSFVKRKMVNSGDAIRKIAKTVKDGHLYAAYNRAHRDWTGKGCPASLAGDKWTEFIARCAAEEDSDAEKYISVAELKAMGYNGIRW